MRSGGAEKGVAEVRNARQVPEDSVLMILGFGVLDAGHNCRTNHHHDESSADQKIDHGGELHVAMYDVPLRQLANHNAIKQRILNHR